MKPNMMNGFSKASSKIKFITAIDNKMIMPII